MPDLPRYSARITPKPVGKAPIPVEAADVGAGAIGRGLQWLGRGIADIGKTLFTIDEDKQRIRDNALLASANGDRDKQIADSMREARNTTFTDFKQFDDFREKVKTDLDAIEKNSISKMSYRASQDFSNYAKNNRQSALRQIEGIVWQKEIEFQQNETRRQYTNKFETMASAGFSVEDILADPSLDIIEDGMNPYWKAGELEKIRERTLIDALVNVGRYEDARALAQTTDAFTSTEKQARLVNIGIIERAMSNKRDSDSKIMADALVRDTYTKIVNGNTDIRSMALAILSNPIVSDDDKNAAIEKAKTFFSTWHSAVDAEIVTSDSTRVKALKIISAVRTADITEDEGLAQYIELSKAEKINGIDGKGFINGIFAASKSAEIEPLSTNRAKIYFGNLESLYKEGTIESLDFDKKHTALRNFFDQEKPPTPEEAHRFWEELMSDVTVETLDKMWRWWVQSPFGFGYRKITGIEKEGEEDLSKLSDEELEAIIRAK